MTRFGFSYLFFFWGTILTASTTHAIKSPKAAVRCDAPVTAAPLTSSTADDSSNNNHLSFLTSSPSQSSSQQVFGFHSKVTNVVPTNLLLQIRGGQVHEPETASDVDALILKAGSEQKLVVIDFSATWCGPCKMIAPLFKELSENIPGVVFIKVDVDENPDTAAKYNVSAMPTFVFIKGGEVVDRLMGASPARLQELIDEHK